MSANLTQKKNQQKRFIPANSRNYHSKKIPQETLSQYYFPNSESTNPSEKNQKFRECNIQHQQLKPSRNEKSPKMFQVRQGNTKSIPLVFSSPAYDKHWPYFRRLQRLCSLAIHQFLFLLWFQNQKQSLWSYWQMLEKAQVVERHQIPF